MPGSFLSFDLHSGFYSMQLGFALHRTVKYAPTFLANFLSFFAFAADAF